MKYLFTLDMDLNVASISLIIKIADFIGFYCSGGKLMLYFSKKHFGKRIPIAVASER